MNSTHTPFRGNLARLLVVLAIGAVLGAGWWWKTRPSSEEYVQRAELALAEDDLAGALESVQAALHADPQSSPARLVHARVLRRQGRFEAALEELTRVPQADSLESDAQFLAGEILLQDLVQPERAEPCFRRVLARDAAHVLAHDRLAYLLGVAGRSWEMVPHQLAALQLGNIQGQRLYLLSLGDRFQPDPKLLERQLEKSPRDAAVRLSSGLMKLAEGHVEQARTLLTEVVQAHPEWLDAQVHLGRLHLEHGREDAFRKWETALPAGSDEHPGTWVLRGHAAQRRGDGPGAARCFWEALRRDPNHAQANYQLGQLLGSLEPWKPAAGNFLQRAEQLARYAQRVSVDGLDAGRDVRARPRILALAQLADELDLLWEAAAWRWLAAGPPAPSQLDVPPDTPLARTLPDRAPARQIDLSNLPLPGNKPSPSADPVLTGPVSSIQFEDRAAGAGIDFVYFGGDDPAVPGQRIFETIGGGVAVLDYDGDSRPDLYFTQGQEWPRKAASRHRDALYRQRGDGTFSETGLAAGLRDRGYGQGVTAGDFDNDGFTDLYVAHMGPNQFYRNNGDGTFTDVTAETGTAGSRWSTSCVLADLNGDSWPDLYVVNYLAGSEVEHLICHGPNRAPRVCAPNMFAAAEDEVYLNLGDGRFEEQTRTAGIQAAEGRGLGIVAVDLEGAGRISLFVANDQSPNFLLANQTERGSASLRFAEEGLVRGLALNGRGQSQASMGIAVGDANQDGRPDFLVTNFLEEGSTLHVQEDGGLFDDASARSGLLSASRAQLGFGTQFLDADLDGLEDLIVTNGHIDDQRAQGVAYQMPPQFFRNTGAARFEELPATQLGPYFRGRYLGRGLARVDWNGDGREDAVVSHIGSAAALVTNTTPRHGNWLQVRLVGTESARDAVGAILTAHVGTRSLVRQLTAGDGFQASNEKLLTFGLADHTALAELVVRWPSGREQRFRDLAAGERYLVIEGNDSPAGVP